MWRVCGRVSDKVLRERSRTAFSQLIFDIRWVKLGSLDCRASEPNELRCWLAAHFDPGSYHSSCGAVGDA
ncbi:hypothetical protein SKAU_G00264910 [Synaphobranchus kaupii]|uniref:Uncharacterized protein n=1 Tax=Synaphobranchus kaupii TaxID=118154 RepID=A0A9Q1EZ45_SYNKA|nr:hypothetical protein SKAU_G00264910 [Synaphobranchus kaupii]